MVMGLQATHKDDDPTIGGSGKENLSFLNIDTVTGSQALNEFVTTTFQY
jgi:hypothetical protein